MRDATDIRTDRQSDAITVVGTGELDVYVGKKFDQAIADAAASGEPVTLDLTEAAFIDSAILLSIARHGKAISKRGGRLKVVVAPGSHPDYVLKTAGFGTLMDVVTG